MSKDIAPSASVAADGTTKTNTLKVADIKRIQQFTEGRKLYLMKQGLFWHAYNEAARYLAILTGYKVRERYTPSGDKYDLLGFPVNTLPHVINVCTEADADAVIEVDKNLVRISFKDNI